MTQTAQPQVVKSREEMWWLTLAKSKTMRFFSVSCEFLIFIGCLWLTLATILPDATGWFDGSVDKFFLVAMGFAVDAALPEAWLHVVDQWTDTPRKKTQLSWSIPVAIGMLLLVIANIIYTKLTENSKPSDGLSILVNILLITRMFVGISYVTIRECQSFLDRKTAKQTSNTIAAIATLQDAFSTLQADMEQRIAAMAKEQAAEALRQLQATSSVPQSANVDALRQQLEADHDAKLEALRQQLEADHEARLASFLHQSEARLDALMRQRVTVSEATETRQLEAPKPRREAPSNVVPMRLEKPEKPTEVLQATGKREAVYKLLDAGDTRSSYQLAPIVGCSTATIQRYMRDWKADHDASPDVGEGAM